MRKLEWDDMGVKIDGYAICALLMTSKAFFKSKKILGANHPGPTSNIAKKQCDRSNPAFPWPIYDSPGFHRQEPDQNLSAVLETFSTGFASRGIPGKTPFDLVTGVGQGKVARPFLFNFAIDDIIVEE
ncbi:hypothetical protein RB195_015188 [Necator americanus]|uniref:Uncharacterized protein n=1 Tax=Necator americanus TaxID=51031 RepID=A0ABR1E3M7_NECAM